MSATGFETGPVDAGTSAWVRVPSETEKDFTCNFEKFEQVELDEAI